LNISMLKIIWAFIKRDIFHHASYRLSFVLQFFNIFPVVLMFFFLSGLVDQSLVSGPLTAYGGKYFPFVLIGIAFQNYLSLAMTNFSASIRDSQLSGTLETVLATPVSLPTFLIGSTAYSFICNSLRILVYVGFGAFFCEFAFSLIQIPVILVIIILTIAAFSSLGIFSASFILLFKKGDPVNWLFSVLSWLLGGVYYPVSILPGWLQKVAAMIPMTHSLEAFRLCLLGGCEVSQIAHHLWALLAWALIGLPVSFFCFRFALNRSRKLGTLGQY